MTLTDHKTHRSGESIYPLLRELASRDSCECLDVVSRGDLRNSDFFLVNKKQNLYAIEVNNEFEYSEPDRIFLQAARPIAVEEYDVLLLRLDRPVSDSFLSFLESIFPPDQIINRPSGVLLTGSKRFLLNFPQLCPSMEICSSIDQALELTANMPVVFKPLHSYGGKCLVRIDGAKGWVENKLMTAKDALEKLGSWLSPSSPFLGMRYLKNVTNGDKRVLMVGDRILGATLRLPPKDSWLCNISMGGEAIRAEADENEVRIAQTIAPEMISNGILIYGFDTLEDDGGTRVLSEINTLNVGGFHEAELHSGKPVIAATVDLIVEHIENR